MSQATFLMYSNQVNHRFVEKLSLEDIFFHNHPYDISQVTVLSGSRYSLYRDIEVCVYANQQASLHFKNLNQDTDTLRIYVNGVEAWRLSSNGIYVLKEKDLLEISWQDKTEDALYHIIIIVTSIQ